MSAWWQGPMVAFDLETTGPDPLTARIVTASLIRIDGTTTRVSEWLLNPEVDIPQGATDVHGVTTEHARTHGMDYGLGYKQIRAELDECHTEGRVLVIYNSRYDLTVMHREGERQWIDPEFGWDGLVIDPLLIHDGVERSGASQMTRWWGRSRLADVCRHHGVDAGQAHESTSDALAAARLAWTLGHRYRAIVGDVPAEKLMADQADWAFRRAMRLVDYFDRQGDEDRAHSAAQEALAWPIRKVARSAWDLPVGAA